MNNQVLNSEDVNNSSKKQKNNKGKIILLIIIVFILLILGILGFYCKTNSKMQVLNRLNQISKMILNNNLENKTLESILKSDIKSNELSISLETPGDLIQPTNFNLKYIQDEQAKKNYLNGSLLFNSEEFLNLDSLMTEDKIYFSLKDITEGYYFSDFDYKKIMSDITNEEIKYITNILKDKIVDHLKKLELNESKTAININNKDIKVKKISLKITDTLLSNISTDFLNNIKSDKKAKDIILRIADLEENEFIKEIDVIIEDLSDTENKEILTYNLYVKMLGEFVKEEVITDNDIIEHKKNNNINEYLIKNIDEENAILNLKITKEKSSTIFEGNLSETKFNGTYNNDNKIDLVLKNISGAGDINVNIVFGSKVIKENEEYLQNIIVDVNTTIENENISAKLKIDNLLKSNETLPIINIDNSKPFTELSEIELQKIFEKLMEIPGISNIIFPQTEYELDTGFNSEYNYEF